MGTTNTQLEQNRNLTELIASEAFCNLSVEDKHTVIDKVSKSSGIFERLWGADKEIVSLSMAFLICLTLIVVGAIVWIISREMQIWTILSSGITTIIGFICGKSSK